MTKVLLLALLAVVAFSTGVHNGSSDSLPQVVVHQEKIIEYRMAPRSKDFWFKLIDYYSDQFDVEKAFARTIYQIESSEGVNTYAFNEHKLKDTVKLSDDKLDQQMLASALCPFQVLGMTAKTELGQSWEQIAFDPVECVRGAVYYMRKLKDRFSKLPAPERRRAMFLHYFGKDSNGQIYADNGMNLISHHERLLAAKPKPQKKITIKRIKK